MNNWLPTEGQYTKEDLERIAKEAMDKSIEIGEMISKWCHEYKEVDKDHKEGCGIIIAALTASIGAAANIFHDGLGMDPKELLDKIAEALKQYPC